MPALTTITILGVTFQTLYAVAFIASVALSYVISSLNQPDGLRGSNQTDPGVRSQVPPDSTTPVPVVYGSAYLGGRFVDACIREDQKVMYYVHVISCLSDNGQFSFDTTKMYYGDRLITFDTSGGFPNRVVSLTDGAGNVDTTINNLLFISLYTSDASGNITAINSNGKLPWEYMAVPESDGTSLLMGTGSGLPTAQQWTSTGRRMNGLAFAVVRLSYSREAGTTQLQPVTYHVTQNLNGTGTAKPGDVWYDYMTNDIYGAAIDPDFVDASSRLALNTYSDELITFNNYSGTPTTQARYRINGVVDTNKAVLKNIDDIMQACDSWLRYEASTGLWSVTINKAETPALALNDNNIIGSIVVGTVDLAQTVNVVEAKFPDSTNRDQYNYVNEAVPAWLLYPNEPLNKQTLTYELVNDSVQALYLANRVLEQGREDLTITVNTTYVGIQLSAGDVVSITNAAYGWTNKLFRCMQVQESVTQDGSLGAQLQLSEYNAQVYDNFDITQFTPAPNTDLPSSFFFSALSAPTVINPEPTAVIPVFDVQCTIPTTGRVTNVNLYYTTDPTPAATDWTLWGTQSLTNSQPYTPSSTVVFDNLSLKPATYYFGYKVANETATSILSPMSVAYIWNPSPANASTFSLMFSPPALQVPYASGSANLTGITFRLYGSNNQGEVEFVTAQTDADASFVNDTWRIGDSELTGYSAIVKSGIVVGNPTDGGNFAQFPQPTSMLGNPATVTVPARYKDTSGMVTQIAALTLQLVWNEQGTSGTNVATPTLYQWSTAYPSNPSGQSTYTWSSGTNTAYTGGGGWSTTIGSNSGVPLLQLYTCTKQITAPAGTSATTVDWSSGYSIQSVSGNGAAGVQQASPTVYKWAVTIPSGPTGTSTYTWSSGTFTPTPSSWSLTPGTAPSVGYTLWGASVSLVESATVTSSTINWTTASITARGYAGTNGTNGTDGTDGTNGASARICYTKTTLSSLASTPATITTSGSASFPPANSWGTGTSWQATPPAIVAGESVYQSDGIYSPTTGNTVWNVPYLSALKVGSLSAITTNTGNLTVTGTIQASTAAISGTTMTGAGAVIYNDGRFAMGNSSGNITYNGSQTTINGNLVATGNVQLNAISTSTAANVSGYTSNLSLSITTAGGKIYISGAFFVGGVTGPASALIQLYRGGSLLATFEAYVPDGASAANVSVAYSETPPTGINTYTFVKNGTYMDGAAYVIELKR